MILAMLTIVVGPPRSSTIIVICCASTPCCMRFFRYVLFSFFPNQILVLCWSLDIQFSTLPRTGLLLNPLLDYNDDAHCQATFPFATNLGCCQLPPMLPVLRKRERGGRDEIVCCARVGLCHCRRRSTKVQGGCCKMTRLSNLAFFTLK
jgi:hypothetical protein